MVDVGRLFEGFEKLRLGVKVCLHLAVFCSLLYLCIHIQKAKTCSETFVRISNLFEI